MAVREFTDSKGTEWRVWDVTPHHMHPATRSEDFMGNLQDGWLVFESEGEKRRLEAPYPGNWTLFSLSRLEDLCVRAVPVLRRAAKTTTGQQRANQAATLERDAEQNAHARRTFISPGGREWTVRIHECLDRAGSDQLVLRFTTEDLVVELSHWRDDWLFATVEQYALMLLDANPPRRRPKGEGPQRRSDDRVTLGNHAASDSRPAAS